MAPAAGASWKNGSSRCQGRSASSAHPNRAASEASSSRFHSVNGCCGRAVDVGQRREQPVFVEFAGLQCEREVVAIPEVACGLITQSSELADVSGDFGSDLLRGVPCRTSLGGIVAGAKDLGDRVVVDPTAVDLAHESC